MLWEFFQLLCHCLIDCSDLSVKDSRFASLNCRRMNKDINVMIKAIMLDVDGTLVSFETHKVLPSSVDALRKIHDGGIRIVIALSLIHI